ncbi:MAG: hypothetical protein HY927_10520 [Elusimicrobia bacterium]|nr:hypothetical protein [Elusimicrobiota bacterium]
MRNDLRSVAAILALACRAGAADVTTVQPTTLEIKAPVYGTVEAQDLFRLKADIEGRVEAVMASTFTWATAKTPLALLSNKELAAIIDSRGSTSAELIEARWQNYYRPTRIFCPEQCFLLKTYAKTRQMVMPDALLFEAAKKLRLVGHVDPQYADYVRFPQQFEFWPVGKPSEKRQAGVANFYRTGADGRGGWVFSRELSPDWYFDPGTKWEGLINVNVTRKLVGVPTSALFEHEGSMYLPVRVSTGVTAGDFTEILGGVEEGRPVLVFEHAKAAAARPPGPGAQKDAAGTPAAQAAPRSANTPPKGDWDARPPASTAPLRETGLAVPKRKPVGRQAATPKEEEPLEEPAQAKEAPAPEPEEEPAPKEESSPEPPPKKDKAGEDPYAD